MFFTLTNSKKIPKKSKIQNDLYQITAAPDRYTYLPQSCEASARSSSAFLFAICRLNLRVSKRFFPTARSGDVSKTRGPFLQMMGFLCILIYIKHFEVFYFSSCGNPMESHESPKFWDIHLAFFVFTCCVFPSRRLVLQTSNVPVDVVKPRVLQYRHQMFQQETANK